MEKLSGIYTALCTPVKNGTVDKSALEKLICYVTDNGCKGIVVLGGTGEYCALSQKQRLEAVKAAVEIANGKVPVIAGVIGPGLPEAIEIGGLCKESGIDAIMAVTPYYVVANQDGIIDYYQSLMKAVSLPLVLYNIPYRTGVNMLPETVERLLDNDKAGQIIGIKECTPNLGQALDLLNRVKDRISFLCGEEYLFLTEISCGGSGAILASSNLIPEIWVDLFETIKRGNLKRAHEIVLHTVPLLRQVFAETNPGPLKQAMKLIGIDCGDALSPLTTISDEVIERLPVELNSLLTWYSDSKARI
ncbi:MAG: 4-hydroxy-tetrahydrodipicolinate synthase [Synergistaceae bacterium]|nr:4-hydroxy-tetrahydrodipicolinate synthase [Synergistaceae bacterium]